jgi:hypothetical protein
MKASSNPEYHAKLKYNACNVMGKKSIFPLKNSFYFLDDIS